MTRTSQTRLYLAAAAAGLLTVSCNFNIFDPLDSPSTSEEQLLSAARACLDRGNYECARERYAELDGTGSAEVAASELAFTLLDEVGGGIDGFLPVMVGSGSAGEKMTTMADRLTAHAGEATRKQIYEAYRQVEKITSNTKLRGLVRFAAGFALAAEILAEEAGNDGRLTKSDLAIGSSSCTTGTCAVNGNCDSASASKITTGAVTSMTGMTFTATAYDGSVPTWGMFQGALNGLQTGGTELSSGGGSSEDTGSSGSLADNFSALDPALANRCFRANVLEQGIGHAN